MSNRPTSPAWKLAANLDTSLPNSYREYEDQLLDHESLVKEVFYWHSSADRSRSRKDSYREVYSGITLSASAHVKSWIKSPRTRKRFYGHLGRPQKVVLSWQHRSLLWKAGRVVAIERRTSRHQQAPNSFFGKTPLLCRNLLHRRSQGKLCVSMEKVWHGWRWC